MTHCRATTLQGARGVLRWGRATVNSTTTENLRDNHHGRYRCGRIITSEKLLKVKCAAVLYTGLYAPTFCSSSVVQVYALPTLSLYTLFSARLPPSRYALVQHLQRYKLCAYSNMYGLCGRQHIWQPLWQKCANTKLEIPFLDTRFNFSLIAVWVKTWKRVPKRLSSR